VNSFRGFADCILPPHLTGFAWRSTRYFFLPFSIFYTIFSQGYVAAPPRERRFTRTGRIPQHMRTSLFSVFRLKFPADQEREFFDDYFRKSLKPLRSAILFGTILYGLFGVLDAWFIPHVRFQAWIIRFAIVCPGCLATLFFTYSPAFKKYMQQVLAAGILFSGIGIIAIMVIANTAENNFYYGGIVLMIIYSYTFIKLRFVYASFVSWAIVVLYEIAAVWIIHTSLPILLYNNFIFLSANFIGMFSCYQTEHYIRKDFLQNRTVKELEERKHFTEKEKLQAEIEKATKSLQESEAKFRALAQTTTAAIFMHRGGKLIYANPAGEAMTGYSTHEILEKDFWALVHPDYVELIKERGRARLRGEDLPPEYEFEIVKKNGAQRWVRMTAGPIDYEGQPAIIGTLFDVTDIRIAAESMERYSEDLANKVRERTVELEEAQKVAIAANTAKSEFLANISHELRTPLNSIIGFSEVMKDGMTGPVSDDQREYLKDIWESGRHLLRLINDILDLSKIEAGMMELELGEVSPTELIEGSIIMFKEKALRHRINLITSIAPNVASLSMRADERKLKQVILNLTSNAFKFSPEGGTVEVIAEKRNGDLLIAVSDTGIGMAPEDIGKLFQPFKQLDTTLTKKFEGTGLGLHLSKKFVDLHGGTIHVESTLNKGSRFSFTIPIRSMP
jgi:PAS domain S-box-containing protein